MGGKTRSFERGAIIGSSDSRCLRGRLALALTAAAACVLSVPLAFAAGEPSETPIATTYVADGPISATAHAGNRTYIGGKFSHVGPRVGHGVAFNAPDVNGGGDAGIVPTWPEASDDVATAGDPAFPQVIGGEVRAVAPDGQGGWYVGGDFTDVGGQPANSSFSRLVHILPSGELDTAWRPNPNEPVLALAVNTLTPTAGAEPVSALYVGGKFTSVGGASRNYLAAYKLDATTGEPFVPTCTVAAEAANCPIPGYQGSCAAPAGQVCSFDPKTPLNWKPEPNEWVRAIAVKELTFNVGTPVGTPTSMPLLFVGGDFAQIGGQPTKPTINRIAAVWGVGAQKADGSSSASESLSGWAPGSATAGEVVNAIAVSTPVVVSPLEQRLGVYAGGNFASYGSRARLAAIYFNLNVTTGVASAASSYAWNPNPNGPVRSLALEQTGDNPTLFVGGDFTKIGQQTTQPDRNKLASLPAIPNSQIGTSGCAATACGADASAWNPNPDGTSVNALSLTGSGANQVVFTGGDFTKIGSQATQPERNGLAAVAGPAATIGTATAGQALGWDPKIAGFRGVTTAGSPLRAPVNALAVQGLDVYAGGAFTSAGATPRRNLAALDNSGVLDGAWDPSPDDTVRALAVGEGVLYTGGDFKNVGASPRTRLAALNLTTGAVDPTWNPGATSTCTGTAGVNCTLPGYTTSCKPATGETTCELPTTVMALDVTKRTVYVGGAFAQAGGADRFRLAAIRPVGGVDENNLPASGQAIPGWDPKPNDAVRAIDASCDTVYAGGSFTQIGAPVSPLPERNRIAALRPVGALDGSDQPIGGQVTPWNPNANAVVHTLDTSSSRQTIYAGGAFATIGGQVRQKAAALNASDGLATGWNPSGDGVVRGLAVSGDNQTVYAGGSFFNIGGETRNKLAALEANGIGDGTGDALPWAPEPNDTVQAVATQADTAGNDKVFAGGAFTEMKRGAQNGYAAFGASPAVNDAGSDAVPDCSLTDSEPPAITGLSFGTDKAFHYSLSERATVLFRIDKRVRGFYLRKTLASGARVRRCVVANAANRRRLARELASRMRGMTDSQKRRFLRRIEAQRRCVALVFVRSKSVANLLAGVNTTSLASLGISLGAGGYAATLTATDRNGNVSRPARVDFKL